MNKYAAMAAHDLQRAGHKHPNPLTLLALARLYKNLKGDNHDQKTPHPQ